MTDTLSHWHMYDFKARAAVAVTTELVREAQRRHGLDPITTIAVGRAISCAALLASTLKQGKEYVHCSFAGDGGAIHKVIGECNGDGECRGYAVPPRIMEELPKGAAVPESVGEAMGGGGLLTVTRARPGDKAPYTAVIALANGQIATDVAKYLTESEQIPSAVAAGVKLAPDGQVLAAGGVVVQKMGGAELDEAVLVALEKKMSEQLHLSDRIAQGEDDAAIVGFLAGEQEQYGRLTTRPLKFQCSCSRQRMADAMVGLGEEQLTRIKEETGRIEVRCPYCADVHNFTLGELFKQ